MTSAPARIPPLPVLCWAALRGPKASPLPSLLALPGVQLTTSGRAAILLALEALGIGPGQRVLVPTYHCPTMVAPVVARGAAPLFYPLDSGGAPQLDWLERCPTDGVRALIVAHLFGLPQPMAALRAWCDRRGVALIEDCAHALFGSSGGRAIGTWGDMAIGSLVKFLPVPEGGCLVVNGAQVAPELVPPRLGAEAKAVVDSLDAATRHGRLPGLNAAVSAGLAAWRRLRSRAQPVAARPAAAHASASAPSPAPAAEGSMDTARAHRQPTRTTRFLVAHLPRQGLVERRRALYADLAQGLAGHGGLHPLMPQLPAGCAPYVFPLWVDAPDPAYAELRRRGIPVFRWNWLWPGTPAIVGDSGSAWADHVLQLGCHQALSAADVDRIVQTVLELFAQPAAPGDAPSA